MFDDVAVFHKQILNQAPAESPSLISRAFILERTRFMQEELDEFTQAGFEGAMTAAADGLADIVYVAIGTAYLMGLPFDAIWNAVQAANMRKVRGKTSRGNEFDAAKPPGWVGPERDISAAILASIDREPTGHLNNDVGHSRNPSEA
jgi:predicted HAD superfamily Cof-like phosphohydrolase